MIEVSSDVHAGWDVDPTFSRSFFSPSSSSHLNGSDSCTSRAAPRILPSFRAWARAFSSTRPPLAELTRNAPWRICTNAHTDTVSVIQGLVSHIHFQIFTFSFLHCQPCNIYDSNSRALKETTNLAPCLMPLAKRCSLLFLGFLSALCENFLQ